MLYHQAEMVLLAIWGDFVSQGCKIETGVSETEPKETCHVSERVPADRTGCAIYPLNLKQKGHERSLEIDLKEVTAVVLSHIHGDHVGGLSGLKRRC
jgi:glyoxylase-like metal-dependent hydrolase (beta-lactamase superfamily II)